MPALPLTVLKRTGARTGATRAERELALPPPTSPGDPSRPEDAVLEGQAALARAEIEKAQGCFQRAVRARPDDPDYASYFGWTQVLSGDRSNGIARLMAAMRDHPQSMRPLFFLGLAAARDGDLARARALLQEATRRAPEDVEVQVALSSVS